MKINTETLIFIIITVLILVVRGLSKRRKKPPVIKSNLQNKRPSAPGFQGKNLLSDAVNMMNDPLANLEKIFNIPEETEIMEGESPAAMSVVEQGSSEMTTGNESLSGKVAAEEEAQSLEVIVDEVSEYLKDKEIEKSALQAEKKFDDLDLTSQKITDSTMQGQKKRAKIPLFKNVNEIKRAVIYSEILNRKEF